MKNGKNTEWWVPPPSPFLDAREILPFSAPFDGKNE
jgi:hypothetical protein